jgi:methyltransferase family protein/glycosyl transferase family 2
VARAPVIVSMTTVPSRNGTVGPIVGFLRNQTRAADEIRVYLTPGCERVPGARNIETADLGPVTKLSAVADPELTDDAIVVTCDDDQIYRPEWLATLVDAAERDPGSALGLSGWNVAGFLRDPARGRHVWMRAPACCDVLEGFAGVAYRKKFFAPDVFDVPATCRLHDDVWIGGYLAKRGVPRRLIGTRLCNPAATDAAGLHTRKDWPEINRVAVRAAFGPAPLPIDRICALPFGSAARPSEAGPCNSRPIGPTTTAATSDPLLTICIPSLAARAPLLARLLACLGRQPRAGEVEILVAVDDGQVTTGAKRNQLVAAARGAYVCHVDDDDLVAPDYLACILEAIGAHPGVDAVYVRGQRRIVDGQEAGVLTFDYGCAPSANGRIVDDALWREVGHLCPVRAAIAKAVPFPEITVGEDLKWASLVAPKIATSARAGRPGQVLYYYEFSPHKARPGSAGPRSAAEGQRAERRTKIAMPEPLPPPPPPLPSPPPPPARSRARRRDPRDVQVTRGGVNAPAAQVNTPIAPAAAQGERERPLSVDHAAIFMPQYTDSSGPGSALAVTEPYRAFLEKFIAERGIKSIVDLGCGDFEIMGHTNIGTASYLGIDVIAERVARNVKKVAARPVRPMFMFSVGDARELPLSSLAGFDLLICKDVLQHWTNAEVSAWLARWYFVTKRPKYALVTNCNYGPTVNRDVAAGGWRALDLTQAPFGVGEVVLRWDLPRGPHVDSKDVVLLQ